MSERRRIVQRWRLRATLLAVLAVLIVSGRAPAIELLPGEGRTIVGADTLDLPDPAASLTPAAASDAFAAGGGVALTGSVVVVPRPLERHWLSIELVNTGERPDTWHLATRIPFRPDVSVFLARAGGGVERLIETGPDTTFGARPVATRFLVSRGFRLAPGERARLIVRHRSAEPGALPMSLEPAHRMIALAASDAAGTALFYGASIAALAGFALFSLAVRSRLGLSYAGLFTLALLLVAAIDGVAFQHIWPDWPGWNALAALPLGLLVAAAALPVAGRMREDWPRWRRACDGLAGLLLAAIALVAVVPVDVLVHLVEAGLLLGIAAHAVVHASLIRRSEGLGWLFAGGAVAAAMIAVWAIATVALGEALPGWLSDHPHRLIFIVLVADIVVTVPSVSLRMRRAHEAALLREVDAAQRDAALNSRLFETEKLYSRARDLAATRRRELAAVSHDIRQPLASLRLAVTGQGAGHDTATRQRLAEAFDYLENLVRGHQSDPETDREAGAQDDVADRPVEPYPVALLTGTLEQMFREEAEAKGLVFVCRPVDALLDKPILPLLRLFSNLVSNAVKHTATGTVTISADIAPAAVIVEVSDTGPGMSPQTLAEMRQPARKAPASTGSGLGLAIVDDVAAALGLTVAFDSAASGGTRVRVTLPVAS